MDIFCNNENGANFFFKHGGGDGENFTEIASSLGVRDSQETGRGTTLLYSNNDGELDIIYGNWNGEHRLFVQNEEGSDLLHQDK